jgi:hypothetical protein
LPTEHGYDINDDIRERVRNSLTMVADTKMLAPIGLARILCLWFSKLYPQTGQRRSLISVASSIYTLNFLRTNSRPQTESSDKSSISRSLRSSFSTVTCTSTVRDARPCRPTHSTSCSGLPGCVLHLSSAGPGKTPTKLF